MTDRLSISALMSAVNSDRWPKRWEEFYSEVMDEYDQRGCELLDPCFYDEIEKRYSIKLKYKEYYKRAALEIGEDDCLARVLALVCRAMQDREAIGEDIKCFSIPREAGKAYSFKCEMIPMLSMFSTIDYTYRIVSKMKLPAEHYHYAMTRCEGMVDAYIMRNEGKIGGMHWDWFQLAVEGRLFKVGSFEIELYGRFTNKAEVFRNDNGEIVALACNNPMHREGFALGSRHYEDADGALYPEIVEGDDAWIGYSYLEDGSVSRERICLDKNKWKKVISGGDSVLALHIPTGTKMDESSVGRSLLEIREFLDKYFPDFDYKCFDCDSWLLDTQLYGLIGEESNIAKFSKRFRHVRRAGSGMGVFTFVYNIGKAENIVLEKLPENTMLERLLKERYLSGKAIYETYGFIIKDEI